MIIKKFTAKTEEEATKAAKDELGARSVVMNVRKVKQKGFFSFLKKPLIEVTAAVEEDTDSMVTHVRRPSDNNIRTVTKVPFRNQAKEEKPKFKDVIPDDEEEKTAPKAPVSAGREEAKSEDKAIEEKIDNLHTLIEQQLKNVMENNDETDEDSGKKTDEADREFISFVKLIYNTLINSEVDEKYANELVDEIEKLKKPGVTIDYLISNIYQKLILKFGEPARITPGENGARIIFFIGPTGVGKTTTIAKIASQLAVNDKKKVALITTDTYRIKAAEQLRTYADIMEVPFRIAYNEDDVKENLEEFAEFDYILVDTAGYSPKDEEKRMEMKQLLDSAKKISDIDTYLVMSITTKYRDLISISDLYRQITDYRLIFTKLDETEFFGNMLNIKLHTGVEIAYVTNGQEVPKDIEVFNPQSIVRSLLGGEKQS
ncbi:MAG: flagellar biosynthesis protein FlhF [Lachnospiraceae bacterium]|nr:flagellar biosynthesis protein FlhF [Lachnospiraceae bacterium]